MQRIQSPLNGKFQDVPGVPQSLEKVLEAMGDVVGPAVEVKAELIKARAAANAVDVEIDQCRKFIARSEGGIKELDS